MSHWWTPERHSILVRMIKNGATATQVGKEVGCTRNAVIGRAHRTGVPLNDNRAGRPKDKIVQRLNGEMEPPKRFRMKLMVNPVVKPRIPPPEGGVAIMDLKLRHCRFPLWGDPAPDIKDKRFCGAETVDGKRWCQEHLEVVTKPVLTNRSAPSPQYKIR